MEETETMASATVMKRRKKGLKKGRQSKKMKVVPGTGKKNKISQKMQKLFHKRAREYNSDGDDDDHETTPESTGEVMEIERNAKYGQDESKEDPDIWKEGQSSDEDEVEAEITKFVEGCNSFRSAFCSIMKSNVDDETLGPVLSARKKFVLGKLAEEDAERKVKGEAKKEKHLIEEKGHTKPANFLDSHEKFLIGVATKGVVKLFNAVNKAQHAQKGLNPSRFKDAKALTKRRKEAFFSELSKTSAQSAETTTKGSTSKDGKDNDQPAWAPLRDTFMLTDSKLKDWDKMAEQ